MCIRDRPHTIPDTHARHSRSYCRKQDKRHNSHTGSDLSLIHIYAAAKHVARGRNLKLTCTLLEVNTLHEDILILINIHNHLIPSILLRLSLIHIL